MKSIPHNTPLILGVGELLWDLLPTGKQLGGAPANFAYHACALGAASLVISRIGDDPLGQEILARLRALNLRTDAITIDPSAPTSTVSVSLDAHGHPAYTIHECVAWDFLAISEAMLSEAARADALCFGSLAQRHPVARAAIHAVLAAAPDALRIFDVNLRQQFYDRTILEHSLQAANVLKLNDGELPVLAGLFALPGDRQQQLAALASRFSLKAIALTCGAQGSLLYQEGRWSQCQARPVAVQDTVGAGDAFTAALTMGLLQGKDLDEINETANEVARYVCSCAGATPPLPNSLRMRFA